MNYLDLLLSRGVALSCARELNYTGYQLTLC